MAISTAPSRSRGDAAATIPVLDLGAYLGGAPGALEATAAEPPQWPPITYDEYLRWWYDANYDVARQND
jgi:hypothetical protein